ncbi:MAG: YIP1 family protein [Pseudomonadales bacterium]|nr:YIP1 family protein [Halieaceae bacterium]MCP5164083.1 YIP1 family protein [Pseudomonadales bacterium]MCP5189674.1 YIP1 family protein [Pseudomonadales bacterium]MCP5203841.1 YIP1 family protein [Pseudomonadales bacterium]
MADDKQPTPAAESEPATDTVDNTPGGFDLGTVMAQARQVITDPGAFYRTMPRSGGFGEPLVFVVAMGAVTGAVFAALSIIGLTGAGAAGLGGIVIMPIALAIASFISAAVMFVIWKLMGSPENYQTAYRCMAYATAILPVIAVVSIIPYLGTVVRTAWGVWLVINASTEVHGLNRRTATIVFGILGILSLLMGLSGESAQRHMQQELGERAELLEWQNGGA